MNDESFPDREQLPFDVLDRIDRVCDRFESAWAQGERPRLEDFLCDFDTKYVRALIHDLLAAEVSARRRLGEGPGPVDYWDRFPGENLAIVSAFGIDNEAADPRSSRRHQCEDAAGFDREGGVLKSIRTTIGASPSVRLGERGSSGRLDPIVRRSRDTGSDISIRYRIDGEIARGGMGAVLKGRDPDLGRDVAVKVLLEKHQGNSEMLRRFIGEAQIGGQLQHPGIVPVYELGTFVDSRPFFAMKLVKGHTLAALIQARRGAPEDRARFLGIFVQVAQAVAYAHARGVIHRDLKPSNVMVGAFGEVQVMDWGLAKVLPRGAPADDVEVGKTAADEAPIATLGGTEEDRQQSQSGSVMGTPSYMAPEQASGEVAQVDERADVFALGSILCEILTGTPAFTGWSPREILQCSARGEVGGAFARLDSCGADEELVEIAKHCLAPRRDLRPRDAGIVADRITAHLAGVQVKLWSAERERAVAEARATEEQKRRDLADRLATQERARRRATVGLAASLVALFALVGGIAAWYARQQQEHAERIHTLFRTAATSLDAAEQADEATALAKWEAAKAALGQLRETGQGRLDLSSTTRFKSLYRRLDRTEKVRTLVVELERVRGDRAESSDARKIDAAYVKAFENLGLDLNTADPKAVAVALAGRPQSVEIAAALDDWTMLRRGMAPSVVSNQEQATWRPLIRIAQTIDPDTWRNELRELLSLEAKAVMRPLETLANDRAVLQRQPVASLVLLSSALRAAGASERLISVLSVARQGSPEAYWANYEMGNSSWTNQGAVPYLRADDAVRFLTAAVAIRPRSATARASLGLALRSQNQDKQAILEFREAFRLEPMNPWHIANAGACLARTGDYEDAIAASREAIRLAPESAHFRSDLASRLWLAGRTEEAIAASRAVIRLEPTNPDCHASLGQLLLENDMAEESTVAFNEAIRLRPNDATFHQSLGYALLQQGMLDDAIRSCRTSIRLKPDLMEAHCTLGRAFQIQGMDDDASAAYREAIRLDPNAAQALCNLGALLQCQGSFAERLALLRKGHEAGVKDSGWRLPSAEWVADAERKFAMAERLPALLAGEDRLENTAERLGCVEVCHITKRYAAAARFIAEAFEADAKLAEDRRFPHRYTGACAAALAASGQGKDLPPPDDEAKTRLRTQAYTWLAAELSAWRSVAMANETEQNEIVAKTVEYWKVDPDLASLRDPGALRILSRDECQLWRSLWEDIDILLEQVQRQGPR